MGDDTKSHPVPPPPYAAPSEGAKNKTASKGQVPKPRAKDLHVDTNGVRQAPVAKHNQQAVFQSNAPAFKMAAGLAAKLEQSVDSPTPVPPPKLASAKKGTMA